MALVQDFSLDPYRPERYYMRGPGPKCRDKLCALRPILELL